MSVHINGSKMRSFVTKPRKALSPNYGLRVTTMPLKVVRVIKKTFRTRLTLTFGLTELKIIF